ncbi:MAG: hypothetical protein ACRDWY_04085 [Actinomycetes bacterium]
MQPLYEVTLTRPWHWGIAVVSSPKAEVPDVVGDSPVVVGTDAIVIKVRHAQDVELEVFEGDWDWATATIHLRSLTEMQPTNRVVVHEGILTLPDGRLAVGDADGEIVVNDLSSQTRVRVEADEVTAFGLPEVWIELALVE